MDNRKVPQSGHDPTHGSIPWPHGLAEEVARNAASTSTSTTS